MFNFEIDETKRKEKIETYEIIVCRAKDASSFIGSESYMHEHAKKGYRLITVVYADGWFNFYMERRKENV